MFPAPRDSDGENGQTGPRDAWKLGYTFLGTAISYDVVLVEGHKSSPVPKVWLLGPDEQTPPPEVTGILAVLERDQHRGEALTALLDTWLSKQWFKMPLQACILIGGRSRRMGSPKHLLKHDGKTWLENTVDLLRQVTPDVVLVGDGQVPPSLVDLPKLPDAPDAKGPIAGVVSAMRWNPWASWIVAACDLPFLTMDALKWILSTRGPGIWGTVPRLEGSPGVEPLLAHYDFRSGLLFEEMLLQGNNKIRDITNHAKIISPAPGADLETAWKNINTQAELRATPNQSSDMMDQ